MKNKEPSENCLKTTNTSPNTSLPLKKNGYASFHLYFSQYTSYSFPLCGQNHPRKHLNLVDAFLRQKRIERILTKIPKAKILTNTEENKIKFIYICVDLPRIFDFWLYIFFSVERKYNKILRRLTRVFFSYLFSIFFAVF